MIWHQMPLVFRLKTCLLHKHMSWVINLNYKAILNKMLFYAFGWAIIFHNVISLMRLKSKLKNHKNIFSDGYPLVIETANTESKNLNFEWVGYMPVAEQVTSIHNSLLEYISFVLREPDVLLSFSRSWF